MSRRFNFFHPSRFVAVLVFAAGMTMLSPPLTKGEEPSVTAVLSSSETGVGEPVELQIKVSGVRNSSPPADITVDGLDIRSTGQMQSFEMRNFDITSSVTFSY